jgi:hypothetical protein
MIVDNEAETNVISIWSIKDLSCGKCIGFPFLSRLFAISQYVQSYPATSEKTFLASPLSSKE